MRARASKGGLTLRIIAGTNNVLLAMDLAEAARKDCLGFSIERTDLDTGDRRWLPNMIRFPVDADGQRVTSARAPIQKFRWGDYTVEPGKRYRYRVIARHGSPADIVAQGAAAEKPGGFDSHFRRREPRNPHGKLAVGRDGGVFQSRRGGERGLCAALRRQRSRQDTRGASLAVAGARRGAHRLHAKADGRSFALHAAIYEFQKEELIAALARGEGSQRRGFGGLSRPQERRQGHDEGQERGGYRQAPALISPSRAPAAPEGAIMHNKFVVLLRKGPRGKLQPVAVWTGSTNWTEGAIYGQLNVGHAIYDEKVAEAYETCFAMLDGDLGAPAMKKKLAQLTPPPKARDTVPHGVTPIFSPQSDLDMIDLYADICSGAKLLLVSAPFLLHEKIRQAFDSAPAGTLRFLLADKEGSFGKKRRNRDRAAQSGQHRRRGDDTAESAQRLPGQVVGAQGVVPPRRGAYSFEDHRRPIRSATTPSW